MLPNQSLPFYGLSSETNRKKEAKLSNQQRFWKKFKTQNFKQYISPISAIASNHNDKNIVAVGHGIQLILFNPFNKQILKQMTNFTDLVSSISIRKDGAVMAIAQQTGIIQVMDTKQKFLLRTFKNHKKKVNALEFGQNNELYSTGQDMYLRMFDVSTGNIVSSFQNAHQDYITCLKVLNDNIVLTGGYDKKINLFDLRTSQNSQLSFYHKLPVQNIDKFSSNLSFAACGGQKITLWDIRNSEKSTVQTYGSKKLISSLKIVSNNSRIVTGSYDNHFKIYRSDTLQLTYQQRFQQSITHLDITNDQRNIVIGIVGGGLLIKGHNKSIEELQQNDKKVAKGSKDIEQEQSDLQIQDQIAQWMKKNSEKKDSLNNKYFFRGVYSKSDNYDIKFDRVKVKKLTKFDKYLKKFQYKEAFMDCLCNNRNFTIFQSLVDEFIQRGCLDRMIKSLKQADLNLIFQSLGKQIHNPQNAKTVLYLAQKILQHHKTANSQWQILYDQLTNEKQVMENLFQLDGMLQLIERINL